MSLTRGGDCCNYPLGIIIHSRDELLYGGVFNTIRNQRDALRDASPAYVRIEAARRVIKSRTLEVRTIRAGLWQRGKKLLTPGKPQLLGNIHGKRWVISATTQLSNRNTSVMKLLRNIRRYSRKCSWIWQEICNFETSCSRFPATDS